MFGVGCFLLFGSGCAEPWTAGLAASKSRFGIGTLLHRMEYLFSVVGTSRCDVCAACSGANPSIANVPRIFVPPATTRAGTAQRAIPTIALNRYLMDERARERRDV